MLMLRRDAASRFGAGALIAVAHILFVLALLHYAGPRVDNDSTPADYIAFAFIPAPTTLSPEVRSTAIPVAVSTRRPQRVSAPREHAALPAPAPVSVTPQAAAADAQTAAAPAATDTLDMESLRSAARQVEKERVPSALERLRTAEQMRALDDNKFSRAVSQAKRPDCQTKYAGGEKANLLLLIPLAIDTITDTGCKW